MRYYLLLFLGISFSPLLFAQNILSVSSKFIEGGTQFSSVQAAIDAATDGSIIHIYPGNYNESIVINDKALFLIGPGYGVGTNYPEAPIYSDAFLSANITISGSKSVIMEGLHIHSLIINSAINTEIKRCRIQRARFEDANALVKQSYVSGSYWAGSNYGYNPQIHILGNCNLEFTSTIFNDGLGNNGNRGALLESGLVKGNATSGSVIMNNCFFKNRLFLHGLIFNLYNTIGDSQYAVWSGHLSGSIVSNNLFSRSGTNGINLYNQDLDEIFVGYPTNTENHSFDKRYQIKPNSVAATFATDGGACGPYGGAEPYKPSGLPSIPFIYHLDVPSSGTTGGGLDINIKVRAEN